MPRKQLTEEQEEIVINQVSRFFPSKTERQIYAELQKPEAEELWKMIGQLINVRPIYIRQYYVDSHLRAAFRDSFKEQTVAVDLAIIDHFQKNIREFRDLDVRQKFTYIRQYLRDVFHQPDQNGQFEYHYEQLFDHSVNFLKIDGEFIGDTEQCEYVRSKILSRTGKITTKAPKPNRQHERHDRKEAVREEVGEEYYEEVEEEEPEIDLADEEQYFQEIEEMGHAQLNAQLKKFLEIYQKLIEEEQELVQKNNFYGDKIRNFMKTLKAE
ncbi:Hypothetical_protein [Hexamita inflata]|uniref:Hypothetical_protein n=1 Tax=Hexamita inflata TaxID=28002 RepID=A0AA86PL77_9EUKA|nr:Hypothetical protein HINF_LOCUS18868 [Hexamita inflata]CAI9942090.1 Hypothetical protein HINF_LOCUS29735 [Hexamita inflata]